MKYRLWEEAPPDVGVSRRTLTALCILLGGPQFPDTLPLSPFKELPLRLQFTSWRRKAGCPRPQDSLPNANGEISLGLSVSRSYGLHTVPGQCLARRMACLSGSCPCASSRPPCPAPPAPVPSSRCDPSAAKRPEDASAVSSFLGHPVPRRRPRTSPLNEGRGTTGVGEDVGPRSSRRGHDPFRTPPACSSHWVFTRPLRPSGGR